MPVYGIAIDIGTTTVSLSLLDIERKLKVGSSSFDNPQAKYGEDVITRIQHQSNRREMTDLSLMIRNVISLKVSEMLSQNNVEERKVSDVVIVGNTPMHHLFFDLPTGSLLEEPFRADNLESIETAAEDVGLDLPQASCYAPPLIKSFVGSDALAVILGFGIAFDVYPSLALDIGTNSEIIVQYHSKLWVASAASGPAFEGMALACGVRALDGAIDRIEFDVDSKNFNMRTIGKTMPLGICGVGSISALHSLRRMGLITKEGSIERSSQSDRLYQRDSVYGILLVDANDTADGFHIYLNQMDIRMLQQSKAAIRTVTELLLLESGCNSSEIQNLYITGAFGNGLDIHSATGIDLLPQLPNLVNTNQKLGGALQGAEPLVWSKDARSRVDEIYQSI
ncbi:MAG: DUF4445 domain-containing protein [Candidatus Thorarchaeota archaeon]|nr:DUF4445 domain-containing protein [Candidatus Thorarchaeota archaeon]